VTFREAVSFTSGQRRCSGFVYRPVGAPALAPCVVLAHGFGGTQEGAVAAAAGDFAGAGLIALTFDYRGFGVSGGEPRQVVDIRGQLQDWKAAVAFARGLPGVDPARVGLWGSSLAGGHVLRVAVQDPAIAAVVAQAPFNGFPKRVEGRSGAETRRLLGAALDDWWRGRSGRPRRYIKAVGERGELAVISTEDAVRATARMQNHTWRNEVAPGALIDMAFWYRPARGVRRLAAPLLLSLAEHDRETPVKLTRPIAARAPRGELRRYPCTHFELYSEPVRSVVVGDQISLLRTHLMGIS